MTIERAPKWVATKWNPCALLIIAKKASGRSLESRIMRAKRLTIKQRKEIFLALVGLQDMGSHTNAEAMADIEKQFRIDDAQLTQIIDEGIDKDWLDEPAPVM